MKSTGEVLGVAHSFDDALLKALVASGLELKKNGGMFVTVRDTDKKEIVEIAGQFAKLRL